ncbi:prolyl-tRNA synthetase-like protein [Myxozyma melibiosi]|uniref:proline--tRNA ligase n=1 Tax=Myxozyma melibiosi TaxID=54550 RepID=A0ABR1F3Z3_9ASCO
MAMKRFQSSCTACWHLPRRAVLKSMRTGDACPRIELRSLTKASGVAHNRLSKLYLPSGTVSARGESKESSTDVLIRAGYIRKSSAGIYSLLPLGTIIQRKLMAIIHRSMSMIGASEVSLPALLTPTAWQATGRWANTEIYKLKDASESEFMLAPTHEEEITTIVADEVSSYRQLPVRLYQIGKKYRDELRPRAGMMRGREFMMMDLYTFDTTVENAMATYEDARGAYDFIFKSIGVEYAVSEADSGSIGGDLSHEYHYISSAGEDKLIKCDSCDYAANVEVAASFPPEEHAGNPFEVAVTYGLLDDGTLLVIYHPPGRKVNENLIKRELPTYQMGEEDPVGSVVANGDMMLQKMIRIYDERVPENSSLPDLPIQVNIGNITTLRFPCVEVDPENFPNEQCPSCEGGVLTASKAVEVGHTFYLGTKYSKPLKATYQSKDGTQQIIEMGCYGIGVSRLIDVIADVTRDEHGLCWPVSVAPFEVVIVTKPKSEEISDAATTLYQHLTDAGCEAIIDDREDKSFGWKLSDARFLGFPANVIIGNKFLKTGLVDVESRRTAEKVECKIDEVPERISSLLTAERNLVRSARVE